MMRKIVEKYKVVGGSILPAVLMVCILMLLVVFSVYLAWSGTSLFVAGLNHRMAQHANMESACVLYRNDSTFLENFAETGEFQLYEEDKFSMVQLTPSLWGLYETVTIKGNKGQPQSCRMLGNIRHSGYVCGFYYPNQNNSVIITGNTVIQGDMYLPAFGIRSDQMQSEFFNGPPIDRSKIRKSENMLPPPLSASREYLKDLFEKRGNILYPDGKTAYVGSDTDDLQMLPSDALVVARKITVPKNSLLRGQLFATDTIIIGAGTVLEHPGGIYLAPDNPKRYLEIQSGCIINGYVIVDGEGESDVNYPNYRQFPQTEIRGMVYINGIAHLHGCIKGVLFLQRAVYYSQYGYYDNTIYNASVEEDTKVLFPQWLASRYGKKEIKWLDIH